MRKENAIGRDPAQASPKLLLDAQATQSFEVMFALLLWSSVRARVAILSLNDLSSSPINAGVSTRPVKPTPSKAKSRSTIGNTAALSDAFGIKRHVIRPQHEKAVFGGLQVPHRRVELALGEGRKGWQERHRRRATRLNQVGPIVEAANNCHRTPGSVVPNQRQIAGREDSPDTSDRCIPWLSGTARAPAPGI